MYFPEGLSGLIHRISQKPNWLLRKELADCQSGKATLTFMDNIEIKFCVLCIPSSPQWRFHSVFLLNVSPVICAANTRLSLFTSTLVFLYHKVGKTNNCVQCTQDTGLQHHRVRSTSSDSNLLLEERRPSVQLCNSWQKQTKNHNFLKK